MFDLYVYAAGLAVLLAAAIVVWVISLALRDVSIVDGLWGPLFAFAAATYALLLPETGPRAMLVLSLVAIWAARLCVHVLTRNWGTGEDYRYQEIRRRNEPGFALKSVYLVFGFQAVLAWIISLPLLAAIAGAAPLGALDYVGAALWLIGLSFETIADRQLARFKADPRNAGRVLEQGLWRYSRHPNYFGDCCVWWGFYCFALASGAWWSIVAPVLMTVLLLKVSGVALLEKTIGERRSGYAEYVRRTSAFVPLPPRKERVMRASADLER